MFLAMIVHLLAAVIWVGGMFFAYVALRPSAGQVLEPPLRLALWQKVFSHFFPWVWVCAAALLISGFWVIFGVLGSMAAAGMHVHLMMTLGIIMMAIFAHLYFGPFRRFKQALIQKDWKEGGARLNQIRVLIAINLALGLSVVCIAAGGHY
jgi:uncharacterized membrane protein